MPALLGFLVPSGRQPSRRSGLLTAQSARPRRSARASSAEAARIQPRLSPPDRSLTAPGLPQGRASVPALTKPRGDGPSKEPSEARATHGPCSMKVNAGSWLSMNRPALTGKDLVNRRPRQQRTMAPLGRHLASTSRAVKPSLRLTQTQLPASGRLLGNRAEPVARFSEASGSARNLLPCRQIAGGRPASTGNFSAKRPATSKCSCGELAFPARSGSNRGPHRRAHPRG